MIINNDMMKIASALLLAKLAKQATLATVIPLPCDHDHEDDAAGADCADEPDLALPMILNPSATASDFEEEDAQAAWALQPRLQQVAHLPPGYQTPAS
jgi:hypothetical protein